MSASSAHATLHRVRGALARLASSYRLRALTRSGARSRTLGSPYIENLGDIIVGDDLTLSSVPVVSHLVTARGGRIVIGDRVTIGSGAAIASHAEIRIGDDVRIGHDVFILDTDFHDASDMRSSGASAPVVIESNARLDDRVIVLKGGHVGRGAWIAAGSVVSGAVPPGVFADGVPARARARADHRIGGAVDERVRAVIAETFRVTSPLELAHGPAELPGWDSLGSLRLLLALEDEFSLPLPSDALSMARSVADVVDLVARTAEAIEQAGA